MIRVPVRSLLLAALVLALSPRPGAADDAEAMDRAIRTGDLGAVKALVERGYNLASTDTSGRIAFMRAAWKGKLPVAKYLLAKGSALHHKNRAGETALYLASAAGRKDTVAWLLRKGAKPSVGLSPLIAVANAFTIEPDDLIIARMLLDKKADPNARTATGSTPLHRAAQRGHLDLARMLLDAGADPNARDRAGITPLYEAAASRETHRPLMVKLLLDKGADPNLAAGEKSKSAAMRGSTPLMAALYSGDTGPAMVETVTLLLAAKGIDLAAKNGQDKTALDIAADREKTSPVYSEIRRLLEAAAAPPR